MDRNLQPSKALPEIVFNDEGLQVGNGEILHEDEDIALWIFVHFVAEHTTNTGIRREAQKFIDWQNENGDRTRWYA